MNRDLTLTRRAVRQKAALVADRRRRVASAEEDLAVSIRGALLNGIPAAEVAQLAGISRQRVYQIRDGKR